MKICSKCKIEKPRSEFHKDKNQADGLYNQCKGCVSLDRKERNKNNVERITKNKNWRHTNKEHLKTWRATYRAQNPELMKHHMLKTRYGITLDDYKQMLLEQNNCCMICKCEFDASSNNTSPVVDHCHTTNKVRGALCGACNKALGLFKDSQMALQNAIEYLKLSVDDPDTLQ
jgi:hypothetical protein